MAGDEKLSPEEKLLKVIQEGVDEDEPETADAAVASLDDDELPTVAEGPTLDASDLPTRRVAVREESDHAAADAVASHIGKPVPLSGQGLRIFNRCMAAVALVMAILLGIACMGHVQAMEADSRTPAGAAATVLAPEDGAIPSLEELLGSAGVWPRFLRHPDDIQARTQIYMTNSTFTANVPWQDYVLGNMKLIGLSEGRQGMEAIVVDQKKDIMLILHEKTELRVGEKDEHELVLSEIREHEIVITDPSGAVEVTLK